MRLHMDVDVQIAGRAAVHAGVALASEAHLGAMEALDRIQTARDTVEAFTHEVAAKTQGELDTVKLRAHLAEMEAEDFWENKGKEIADDFNRSSEKAKELSYEAALEVKDYFEKLVEKFTKVV